MTITAKVLADSVNSLTNDRLITFELTYPRMIHSEFMTHRAFSRNAASSRAIPFTKMVEKVMTDPVIPISWGSNKPGMQAGADVDANSQVDAHQIWLRMRDQAVTEATKLHRLGIHKQLVNRPLELFMHITVIASATERENLYRLRDHKDAEPHFQVLAQAMRKAEKESTPKVLQFSEWHLPLIKPEELCKFNTETVVKCSVARCARVSYLNHDGSSPSVEKDLKLYEMLLNDKHLSPFEHQAQAWHQGNYNNFTGMYQFRKMIMEDVFKTT